MNESENTTEVVKPEPILSVDQLRTITSFDDAVRLLQEELGAELFDASAEIGDGFSMLDDKDRLIDVPFVAVAWQFAEGDYFREDGSKSEFAIVRLVTDRGDKFIITDGAEKSGLCVQLRDFSMRTGKYAGLVVKGGLRRSEYDTTVNGQTVHGVTHYLNV